MTGGWGLLVTVRQEVGTEGDFMKQTAGWTRKQKPRRGEQAETGCDTGISK